MSALEALTRIEDWVRAQAGQRELDVRDGRLHAVREHGGGESAYAYDERGDLTRIDAPGGTARFRYDTHRRLIETVDEDGRATAFAYREDGALETIAGAARAVRFEYDDAGRLARRDAGWAGASYRYDARGRLILARTAMLDTEYAYDERDRITHVASTRDGERVEANVAYGPDDRVEAMSLPGGGALTYRGDEHGRLAELHIGARASIRFAYDDTARIARMIFSNGVEASTHGDAVDGRALATALVRRGETLFAERCAYAPGGALTADGEREYAYDALGRTVRAGEETFAYDARDNVVRAGDLAFAYDAFDRILHVADRAGERTELEHDACGALARRRGPDGEWAYRYDGDGCLREVLHDALSVAAFEYDHDGRLARAATAAGAERYLYDPAGDLLAITDDAGAPLRLFVRTAFGIVAEVHGALESGEIFFRHDDRRGSCRLVTDLRGEVVASHRYAAFGAPRSSGDPAHRASYAAHRWYPEVGLYWFGARWYDPRLCRFITPDSYTARPDDARLIDPAFGARAQPAARAFLLDDWLRRPRLRNRYAFCGNDPVNATDRDGHWSFGGFLLSLAGAIWTLPNTLLGLVVEITCLIGEVIRWIVWLVTGGRVTWATPGFDAAASGRLNAFALVFTGGWLGSLGHVTPNEYSGLWGITFGNVFFVNPLWYQRFDIAPRIAAGDVVHPPAYGGGVAIPVHDSLYEHELRHTNQYGWLGPFYLIGLPLWGFYFWDVIVNRSYWNAWCERDARAHSEDP